MIGKYLWNIPSGGLMLIYHGRIRQGGEKKTVFQSIPGAPFQSQHEDVNQN